MIDPANGACIARKTYLTIFDAYDDDPTVDLDGNDMRQWCADAKTAILLMTEDGTLKTSDLLDLAHCLAGGDAHLVIDMLTGGGMHNYLGGRLFAMHHDERR